MYKIGVICILILLLMPLAFAANHTQIISSGASTSEATSVANAYKCLENEISNRSSLSFQEAVFAGMALGGYKTIPETLDREKGTDNCWPKAGCKVKETSQVMLAYQKMGKSTDGIKNWLLARAGTAPDLSWYLEIDSENQMPSKCTVSYDSRAYNVNIAESRELSGNAGPCLEISSSKYLLKVRESCLDKTFEVSCDQAFVSTLLYQKNRGSNVDCLDDASLTCYVSSETHAGASLGRTQEKIKAQCMKSGNSCDYEGTLWAAMALNRAGNTQNVSNLLPYLLALAEDNERFFPYSFLSAVTGEDDYYSNVIQLRKQNQFWELASSPYNRFYDTSLGMIALGASSASKGELQTTKEYLFNIQTPNGCWNNNKISDTGFILYAGWDRRGVSSGTGGSGSSAFCTEAGFSCERLSDCTANGGQVREGFECAGVGICCSVAVSKPSCSAQGGISCGFGQQCTGQSFESSSGPCCLGTCSVVEIEENTCEINTDAVCKSFCGDGEVEVGDSCGASGGVCCVPEEKSSTWLIVILVVLIILVALAIIFRKKIQLWWFSRQGKAKTTPVRPGPGQGILPRPVQQYSNRPMPGMQMRRMPPTRPVNKDKDLDETLKKLRDMSK